MNRQQPSDQIEAFLETMEAAHGHHGRSSTHIEYAGNNDIRISLSGGCPHIISSQHLQSITSAFRANART